jgi:hypothetical protein
MALWLEILDFGTGTSIAVGRIRGRPERRIYTTEVTFYQACRINPG